MQIITLLSFISEKAWNDWIFSTFLETLLTVFYRTEPEWYSAINSRETGVQLQAELLNGQNSIRVVEVVVEFFQRTANTLTSVAQTTASK
jgi:hypothetical protein